MSAVRRTIAGTHGRNRVLLISLAAVALVALALALRCPRLDERPMHTDESVQGTKFCELLEHGDYRYDPQEHHGPTLYYLTLPFAWLHHAHTAGDVTESLLRTVPVVFGVAVVLLTFLIADGLGLAGMLMAALLTCVSTAMVYFSRYYIQETLLLFFTFAMIAASWRYLCRPHAAWAAAAGVCAGLMFATKETAVLSWAAMAVAAAVNWFRLRPALLRVPRWHAAVAVAAAFGTAAIFFTSFFSHPRGLLDAFMAYLRYSHRAGGEGHEKPWDYFIKLLAWSQRQGVLWSEGFVLILACIGIFALIVRARRLRPTLLSFLAVYTIVLFVIYSAIPYKTPWLVLGPLHGLILLAGFGATVCWEMASHRWTRAAVVVVLLAGVMDLGLQAQRATFRYEADERNPWAYAHTSSDLLRLVKNIRDAAAQDAMGKALTIKVISPEYWPLPWYLRDFPNVGYWHEPPSDPHAPIIITTFAEQIEPQLKAQYAHDFGGLRPGMILTVLIRQDLWDGMVAARSHRSEARSR